MREIYGNLWDYYQKDGHIVLITTNGTVKKNGRAVMGAGCAAQAKHRIADIDLLLGIDLHNHGIRLTALTAHITAFPVKFQWWENASFGLIEQSTLELERWAIRFPVRTYILPRPGCGNGHLTWEEVRPLLLRLPDNVNVITKKEPE